MNVSPCSVRVGLGLQKKIKLPWYDHSILKVHAEIDHSNFCKIKILLVFTLNQRNTCFYMSSQ